MWIHSWSPPSPRHSWKPSPLCQHFREEHLWSASVIQSFLYPRLHWTGRYWTFCRERYTPILCAESHHFSHQISLIASTKYTYFFKNLWLICPKGQGRPVLGVACGRASYLLSDTKRPLSGAGWPTWGHWRSQSWKIITSEGRGSRCGKHVLFKAFGCPVGTGW